jgi:phosphoribosylaminoimidazolecarboxamide formyltransferase/IMP cyclohydrolase
MEIKKALISVYDKKNLKDLALFLQSQKIEIISTGGTGQYLKELNIAYTLVEEVTQFPECFGGRVKTLSGKLLGGILYNRQNLDDEIKARELAVPKLI